MAKDKNYIAAMNAWKADLQLHIKQTESSIKQNKDEIAVHKKHIQFQSIQLKHDKKRLATAVVEFRKYLAKGITKKK